MGTYNNNKSKPIFDITNQTTSNYSHSTNLEYKENLKENHIVYCNICGKSLLASESGKCPVCGKTMCPYHIQIYDDFITSRCEPCYIRDKEWREESEKRRLKSVKQDIERLLDRIVPMQIFKEKIPYFIIITSFMLICIMLALLIEQPYIRGSLIGLGVLLLIIGTIWLFKRISYLSSSDPQL